MRDDFTQKTKERLSKRVGFKCSNPACRKPTSGPGADGGTVSLGVAAHITAASRRGPRFDERLTSTARQAIENGIWLCQQCSRLVDADDCAYKVADLNEWKTLAEAAAALELRGYVVNKGRDFADLEAKMPELVGEMRNDLLSKPFTREIIALSKQWMYQLGPIPIFVYYQEEHAELLGKLKICEHYGAIYENRRNKVPRWNLNENFVDYLLGV